MKFESTITSKGTVTIAAPLRKALGLKPGQKVKMQLDKSGTGVLLQTGATLQQLEAIRDRILNNHPNRPRGLTIKQMREVASKKWLAERIAHEKS